MERKIGEIFEFDGEWYQCILDTIDDTCDRCCFQTKCNYLLGACSSTKRSDGKSVAFKKLEKVGEPYDDCGTILQRFKIYTNVANADTKGLELHIYSNDTIGIEIKQNKDMEEKNNGNTPLNVLTDKYVNGDICYDDFEKEVKALYSCKEEIKPTLKPFDLEAAKLGKPVCTRDGSKVRIICFDRVNAKPILALVTSPNGKGEDVFDYFVSGKRIANALESDLDLMMLSEKRSGWVNIDKGGSGKITISSPYSTKEEAIHNDNECTIDTIKIEWEE